MNKYYVLMHGQNVLLDHATLLGCRAEHNQKRAAGLLGLTYHQFRGLHRQYQKDKSESVDKWVS